MTTSPIISPIVEGQIKDARERLERALKTGEKAFTDLPNGCWAKECYLSPQACRDIRALLDSEAEARAQVERLQNRLEMRHAYVNGERVEVEIGSMPDGIECRDETIKGLDRQIEKLRTWRDGLIEGLEPFADLYGEDDDDFPDDAKVTVQFGRTTDCSLRLADIRRVVALTQPQGGGDG